MATRPAIDPVAASGATPRSSAASCSPAATGSSRSASRRCPSGIAALIIATLPLWVAILGRAFFGVHLTRTIVAGTVIGFAGVVVLVWPTGESAGLDAFGVAVVLLSPVFWATGSLFSRTAHVPRRPLVGTAMQMLAGSAVLFVLAVLTGDIFRVRTTEITTVSLAAVGYLTLVGSLVGYTAYVWLLRVAPGSRRSRRTPSSTP